MARRGVPLLAPLAVLVVLAAGACSESDPDEVSQLVGGDEEETTTTVDPLADPGEGTTVSVHLLEVGTCFDDPAISGADGNTGTTTTADDDGTTTTTAAGGGTTTTAGDEAGGSDDSGANVDAEPGEGGGDGEVLEQTTVVDCELPHDAEVFAVVRQGDAEDAEFPGEDALRDQADEECFSRFEDFVGIAYEESVLDIATLWPTEGAWADGDRTITCVVFHVEHDDLEGTMAGAAI